MSWLSRMLGSDGKEPSRTLDEWLSDARSGNGYLRGAAVKALGRSGEDRALPMLLERANDWVPEVREVARHALGVFLQDGHIRSWVTALGQVAALRRASRADHSALLQEIEAFLLRPAHLAALHAARERMSPEALRFLFALHLRSAVDDEVRLPVLQEAVASRDVVVASMGVAASEALHTPACRRAVLTSACRSRLAAVRASALRVAMRSGDPGMADLAAARCLDTSAAVRAIALAACAGDTGLVVEQALAVFHQEAPARERAAALDVLCRLDAERAAALRDRACSDAAGAVRRVAYSRRFAGTPGAGRDGLVLAALKDESPRVRSVAVMQVGQGAAAPSGSELLQLARARPAAVDCLASVARHLPPWERLEFLFDALQDLRHDDAVVHRLHDALERWSHDMAKNFMPPTPAQGQAVNRRWALLRDGLPMHLQQHIAFPLQTFRLL